MSFINGIKTIEGLAPQVAKKVEIGDYVTRAGVYTEPGVVIDKDEDTGVVTVDTSEETINEYHKYANTTGMTLEQKREFNDIMESVMSADNDPERVKMIQSKIDQLRLDEKNVPIVSTLRNEQNALIRRSEELPRIYTTSSTELN